MSVAVTATEKDRLKALMKGLTVLYVEDNEDVREQLNIFLKRRFADVIIAEDGAQGLAKFNEHADSIALVITDIRMPRMDGLEMAQLIKQHSVDKPIIMTTAHEETDYLLEAINIGVEKFIVKPIDTKALQRALETIGQRLQIEQQLQEAQNQLADQEEKYRTLFWTSMDALCVFDWQTLTITDTNRAYQTLLGRNARESKGMSLAELFDSTVATDLADILQQLEASNEVMLMSLKNSQGQLFPTELVLGKFTTSQGLFGVLAARDASERIKNQQEQEQLIESLETSIRAMQEVS